MVAQRGGFPEFGGQEEEESWDEEKKKKGGGWISRSIKTREAAHFLARKPLGHEPPIHFLCVR